MPYTCIKYWEKQETATEALKYGRGENYNQNHFITM